MTTRVFRLFLSSPGDVAVERRRVAAIVSRLNGECAGRARIDVIRWETEAYQAHQTFQAQIPEAVECDLVLGLFKWRLGTELPPDFPRLATGEPYPSGTAYELLTSIEARRQGAETPDVFVYRYGGSAPRPAIDDPARERIEQEWRRLEAFFARWFFTPEGHFKAAFQLYASEDDFEEQVETLLRRWLTDKIAAGRILAWPDAIKGSPYPGLDSYGPRHAAVFFGRSRDVARGVDLWRERAAASAPFLLVVGASGSGKSSLARAGLVPRLTTPGVIEGVDHWRVASFRPGDDAEGPLAALAAALRVSERDLPVSEEGRGPALPELDGEVTAAAIAADPGAVASKIVALLDRLGASEQAEERRERDVRVDLVIVVDQLDELFAPALAAEGRDLFVAALAALLATGRVWIAATLRADLYAAMLSHPGLASLKERGASYDLAPPGPAELAEIVRRPAEAADLAFGIDPATGEGVDERLLREADKPDMLPLVQLALARLYEGRRQETGPDGRERSILPFEVYGGLGGLTGIIDEVGERALAALDGPASRALPRLVRNLAHLEQEGALAGTLTVTPRPFVEVAADEPSRRLVAALVASRLLTMTDTGEGGLVRLAHQRILADWKRAREIVQGSADFYRVRGEIEAKRQRWEASRRSDLLLPRGLPLAEAENAVARYGEEIGPETRAYVRASRARAGRAMMLTGAAAVIFALVAVGALFQWSVAREQTALALRNFGVARESVRGVVFDIVQGLSDVSGMRVDALRRILSTAQKASDTLAGTAPDDAELQRTRGAMFENFARMYASVGDLGSARASADRSVAILRDLARTRPEDARVEGDLAIPLATRAGIASQTGDMKGARAYLEEALAFARIGARRSKDESDYRLRPAHSLNRLGDLKFALGDFTGANAAYREAVEIVRREAALSPGDLKIRDGLWIAIFNLGFVALESGDVAEARRHYDEALAIAKTLAEEAPESPGAQRSLAVMLSNLGSLELETGHNDAALARFAESLAIERRLVREDPENGERRRNLLIALEKSGNGAYAVSNWPAALAFYDESLRLARDLVTRNPFDLRNQRSVTVGLANVAFTRNEMGDRTGARAGFEERLGLARRLAEQQPESAEAKRDLVIAIDNFAQAARALGEPTLDLWREAAGIARALTLIDETNRPPLQLLITISRQLVATQSSLGQDRDVVASLEEQVETARRMLKLRPDDRATQRALADALGTLGKARSRLKDKAGSALAFDESFDLYRALAAAGDREAPGELDSALAAAAWAAYGVDDTARAGRLFRDLVEARRGEAARLGTGAARQSLAMALVWLAGHDDAPLSLLEEAKSVVENVPEAERSEDGKAAWQQANDLIGKLKAALSPAGSR